MTGTDNPVRGRIVDVIQPYLYAWADPGSDRDERLRIAFSSDHPTQGVRVERNRTADVTQGNMSSADQAMSSRSNPTTWAGWRVLTTQ